MKQEALTKSSPFVVWLLSIAIAISSLFLAIVIFNTKDKLNRLEEENNELHKKIQVLESAQ